MESGIDVQKLSKRKMPKLAAVDFLVWNGREYIIDFKLFVHFR